ncbi:DinB family protein [Massilia endophytica]|uniref:DinB family protein n=1 Tax=Massilia endophytica TaxID=2899220 RepID=UPI001E46CAD7|nr:DinB family protein [Massilia endophytica]UGQ47918.1 DinB family protein [Massilia endophytica]
MDRTSHVRHMARYNQWMNEKIYEAAGTLSAEALNLDRKAFFGSIMGTLNHLMVADTVWLKRFAMHPSAYAVLEPVRQLPFPAALGEPLFTDFAELRAQRARFDELIIVFADSIPDADLDCALAYSSFKGVPSRRIFFSLLMHFFNHQTHHRGQVTTLLSQEGIDVGATDLLLLVPEEP